MSYNEFHKGKLHKLTRGMSETENKVKELTKQYDVPFDEDEDLNSNCWDIYKKSGVRYIVVNKDLYIVKDYFTAREEDGIYEHNKNDDGDIEFMVEFYNGGTGFEEVVEDIVDSYEKDVCSNYANCNGRCRHVTCRNDV